MDSLFVLFVLWAILRAVMKSKKSGGKSNVKARAREKTRSQATAKQREEQVKQRQARLEQLMAAKGQTTFAHEELASGESHAVQVQPDETPRYMGSLHEITGEGDDICDPSLGHEDSERQRRVEIPDQESVYAQEIGREPLLNFSPRSLYQGVVMSEILTRPANRARRR